VRFAVLGVLGGGEDAALRALFEGKDIKYVHVRSTSAGCYLFRVERVENGGIRPEINTSAAKAVYKLVLMSDLKARPIVLAQTCWAVAIFRTKRLQN
jgi:hypothetical protein